MSGHDDTTRHPALRRAAVVAVSAIVVVFVIVCVVVGETVAVPARTHERIDTMTPGLPATTSPIGAIAVITALVLSTLAIAVALHLLARWLRTADENVCDETRSDPPR